MVNSPGVAAFRIFRRPVRRLSPNLIEGELQRKIEDFRELGIPPYVPRGTKLHLVDHRAMAGFPFGHP
jgi:hypothetical protein